MMLIPTLLALLYCIQSVSADAPGYCLCYCFGNGGFVSNQTTIDCAKCTIEYCVSIEKAGGLKCPNATLTRQTRCTPEATGVQWAGSYVAKDYNTQPCDQTACCCPQGGVTIRQNATTNQTHISFNCAKKGQQEVFFDAAPNSKHYQITYSAGKVDLVYYDVNDIDFFENDGKCKSELTVPSGSNAGMVVGIIFGVIAFFVLVGAGYWYYKNRIGTGYTQL